MTLQTIATIVAAIWIVGVIAAAIACLRRCNVSPPPAEGEEEKDPNAYGDSFWRPGGGPY